MKLSLSLVPLLSILAFACFVLRELWSRMQALGIACVPEGIGSSRLPFDSSEIHNALMCGHEGEEVADVA